MSNRRCQSRNSRASRRSTSICLRSPAREPSSTLTHEYIHKIKIKFEKWLRKLIPECSFYTNACLLRRSCSNTSAVNRFGRTLLAMQPPEMQVESNICHRSFKCSSNMIQHKCKDLWWRLNHQAAHKLHFTMK